LVRMGLSTFTVSFISLMKKKIGSHGDTVEGESLSDESKGTDRRSPCL